jgi:hypothetical protein
MNNENGDMAQATQKPEKYGPAATKCRCLTAISEA